MVCEMNVFCIFVSRKARKEYFLTMKEVKLMKDGKS